MPRIFQTHVPALLPKTGNVCFMLYGEAPGPRGADQSGIPFWGDRAGLPVYQALEAVGLAQIPLEAYRDWNGATLKAKGLFPVLKAAGLSNAYPVCPTRDGHSFKAPSDSELKDPKNLARLEAELEQALARCPDCLRVITLGRRARWILERWAGHPRIELCALPHPSAQGLLQSAPDKGKGMKLHDLQYEWARRLHGLLMGACKPSCR